MKITVKGWEIIKYSILCLFFIAIIITWTANHDKIIVTAIFEELELYTKRLSVYYNGFKLGRVTKIYLSDDGKTTNVEMRIKLGKTKLPDNVSAKIKTRKKKDFVELEYPKYPSNTFLHDDDVILGSVCFDLTSYINKQADSGGLDEIKSNLNGAVKSTGEMMNALTDLIHTGNEILKDVRPNLRISSENLAETTKYLKYTSKKLSDSTDSKKFTNSTSNIEQTTKNIELATRNLNIASQNIADLTESTKTETLSMVDSTIGQLNKSSDNVFKITEQIKCILYHAEDIVKGIKITLSKKFSGMRIIFGNAIEQNHTSCKN